MKSREVKQSLKEEVQSVVVPDVLSEVKRDLSSVSYRHAYLDGAIATTPPRKILRARLAPTALAVALILILVFGVLPLMSFDKTAYAAIAIDAYPEFEISVNKQERVIAVRADSAAAKEILQNIAYEKHPLEQVLKALVSASIQRGYISEAHIAERNIPIAIRCDDAQGAARLQKCVDNVVNYCCDRARG
jgi:hypothetical protein